MVRGEAVPLRTRGGRGGLIPIIAVLALGCQTRPEVRGSPPNTAPPGDPLKVVPTSLPTGGKETPAEVKDLARRIFVHGVWLLRQQRVDDAVREFRRVLAADPAFYKAHFKLGYCYYLKRLYDLEILEYRLCLAINDDYAPAHLNLAHALLTKGEFRKALYQYGEVLRLEPTNAVARVNRALIQIDMGHFEQAKVDLRQVLELQPNTKLAETATRRLKEIEEDAAKEKAR